MVFLADPTRQGKHGGLAMDNTNQNKTERTLSIDEDDVTDNLPKKNEIMQ